MGVETEESRKKRLAKAKAAKTKAAKKKEAEYLANKVYRSNPSSFSDATGWTKKSKKYKSK